MAHYDTESSDEHYRSRHSLSRRIVPGDFTDLVQIDRSDELGKLNEVLISMQIHSKAMMDEIADLQSGEVSRIAAMVGQLMTSVHEMEDAASSLRELIAYSQFIRRERP